MYAILEKLESIENMISSQTYYRSAITPTAKFNIRNKVTVSDETSLMHGYNGTVYEVRTLGDTILYTLVMNNGPEPPKDEKGNYVVNKLSGTNLTFLESQLMLPEEFTEKECYFNDTDVNEVNKKDIEWTGNSGECRTKKEYKIEQFIAINTDRDKDKKVLVKWAGPQFEDPKFYTWESVNYMLHGEKQTGDKTGKMMQYFMIERRKLMAEYKKKNKSWIEKIKNRGSIRSIIEFETKKVRNDDTDKVLVVLSVKDVDENIDENYIISLTKAMIDKKAHYIEHNSLGAKSLKKMIVNSIMLINKETNEETEEDDLKDIEEVMDNMSDEEFMEEFMDQLPVSQVNKLTSTEATKAPPQQVSPSGSETQGSDDEDYTSPPVPENGQLDRKATREAMGKRRTRSNL